MTGNLAGSTRIALTFFSALPLLRRTIAFLRSASTQAPG